MPGDPSTMDETAVGGLGAPVEPRVEQRWATGTTVADRYVVLERVGSGGMGVVFAAYDPKLDRKVALKVLHVERHAKDETRARASLVREAKSLARLAHPNVVTVHDVGEAGGRVFVAMEFVEGQTLTEWLAQPRSWPEVVAVFVDVARGLGAAHAQGIIHRDVKPANVMIDGDARVRVMDFGLARADVDGDSSRGEGVPDSIVDRDGLATMRTQGVAGTPRYMSPEQHLGEALDARTDQFSFAVALYEALYDKAPFAGETVAAIAHSVLAGDPEPPPRGAVPARVATTVMRALEREPDARWPDLDAMVVALQADPSRRRRAWLAGGALVAAGGVAVGLSLAKREPSPCATAGEEIAEHWNDDRARTVRETFEAVGHTYASASAGRVSEALDDYATKWRAARRDACDATWVARTQSESMLDRRTACLDSRATELESVAEWLARGESLHKAETVVEALTPVKACSAARLVDGAMALPDDPQVRATIAHVEAARAQARVSIKGGDRSAGIDLLRAVESKVTDLGHEPTVAGFRRQLGVALTNDGDLDAAEPALLAAARTAETTGMDHLAADAWIDVASLFGHHRREFERGGAFLEIADIAVTRAGDVPDHRFRYEGTAARIAYDRGDFEAAEAGWREATEIAAAALGETSPRTATAYANLAYVIRTRGRYEDAIAMYRRALEILEAARGPDHPSLVPGLLNLSQAHLVNEEDEIALEIGKRALAISEEVQPAHPTTAVALRTVGILETRRRAYDVAEPLLRRALEINRDVYGDAHPEIAAAMANLVSLLEKSERLEDAEAIQREAMRMLEDTVGKEHLDYAIAVQNLGRIRRRLGAGDEARALYREGRTLMEGAVGPSHPYVAAAEIQLGMYAEEDDDLAGARARYAAALAIYLEAHGPDHRMTLIARARIGAVAERQGDVDAALRELELWSAKDPKVSEQDETHAKWLAALARARRATDR